MMGLNEKLARWAGFRLEWTKDCFWAGYGLGGHNVYTEEDVQWWVYPDGEFHGDREELPDFTSSLDTCFNPDWGLMRKLGQAQYYEVLKSIFLKTDKPALALCKAIEQLIDKETNGS